MSRQGRQRHHRSLDTWLGRAVTYASGILALIAPALAGAEVDLSGEWPPLFHEDAIDRGPGPALGDYTGLPINEAARRKADAYNASLLTLPEHQCKPHAVDYSVWGPGPWRIWKEVHPDTQETIAWRIHPERALTRTIWMDGRAHPPAHAPHSWTGFSTGHWEGDVLVIRTTHIKGGFSRRNGLPLSPKRELTEYYYRYGNYLNMVHIVNDPVYLTEPLIRSTNRVLSIHPTLEARPCDAVVEIFRPQGEVPHYFPGENPYLEEFASQFGLGESTRGGAESMYPSFVE